MCINVKSLPLNPVVFVYNSMQIFFTYSHQTLFFEPKRHRAPFSQPVHTLCPTVPKMDENFFGKPYGSPTPKNTIKIDF